MPQVEFPRRYTIASTLARVDNTNRLFIALEDVRFFRRKDAVQLHPSGNNAFTLYRAADPDADDIPAAGNQGVVLPSERLGEDFYLQQGPNDPAMEFTLSLDEEGRIPVWRVPTQFHISRPAGIITNYPVLPQLQYTAAQTLESNYNPHHQRSLVYGNPTWKGSVEIDCEYADDANLVQSFIDQLADPDAWFECPLPGNHLGSAEVDGYTTATEEITIEGNQKRQNNHLRGWYARVGRKTCRVIFDDTVPVHRSHLDFVLNRGAPGNHYEVEVPDETYDEMTDGDKLTFLSVGGIDGSSSNRPEIGKSYYVKKLDSQHHRIEMYPNANLTGTRIEFSQSVDPINYNLNQFILGDGPYEDHIIKIVPSYLIDGTYTQNDKNNFAPVDTIRVRPTSISATGAEGFGNNPFVIEWTEDDGSP